MTDPDHVAAHRHCFRNREEVVRSDVCGCFYCCRTFPPSDVEEWTDESADGIGQTAICPRCGIDAVIGSASAYPTTGAFLKAMKAYWF
jgi:hypothetical protein